MALPAGFGTGWDAIAERKQKRINETCGKENKNRIEHASQEGGKALAQAPKEALRKLGRARRGPPAVAKHHGNGTVAMKKGNCVLFYSPY